MRFLRNNILSKLFWGLMALYLLNISVDSPDPGGAHLPENLTINDQESIIEIVVEQLLGYEHAFKEFEDLDHEHLLSQLSSTFSFVSYSKICHNFEMITISTERSYIILGAPKSLYGYYVADTPPPKA